MLWRISPCGGTFQYRRGISDIVYWYRATDQRSLRGIDACMEASLKRK